MLAQADPLSFAGLNSGSFQGRIYMTAVTKHLLSNAMEAGERVRYEAGASKVLKFANLHKKNSRTGRSAMDLVVRASPQAGRLDSC